MKRGIISLRMMFYMLVFIPILIGITAFLIYIITLMQGGSVGSMIPELEEKAIESRLIYSPHCFAYRNEDTGRVYSGTIDPKRVNSLTVSNCLPFSTMNQHAVLLEVSYKDKETGDWQDMTPLSTPNWNLKTTRSTKTNTYLVNIYPDTPGTLRVTYKK